VNIVRTYALYVKLPLRSQDHARAPAMCRQDSSRGCAVLLRSNGTIRYGREAGADVVAVGIRKGKTLWLSPFESPRPLPR
jgi:hypothetical protein